MLSYVIIIVVIVFIIMVNVAVVTVQQLVDQDEVVLHVLLADLAEVGGHDVTHLVEELEHHGGVDVLLGGGGQPDVRALHVQEAGAGDVGDGGAHLLPGVNHVDPEGVHCVPPGDTRKKRSIMTPFNGPLVTWAATFRTHPMSSR